MSDPISAIPMVSLLGAMDAVRLMSDVDTPEPPRPAQQQAATLGQEVQLTLSAAALLESSHVGNTLAQLAGNNGPQLATHMLSDAGSYPLPSSATAHVTSTTTTPDTLAALSRPHLLSAPESFSTQPDPSAPSTNAANQIILAPQFTLMALLRRPLGGPKATVISPLIDDPEHSAAVSAQNLYLSYAEPLEQPPSGRLVRRLALAAVILAAGFLVLHYLR